MHALTTCYEVARRLDERPGPVLALRDRSDEGRFPATVRIPLSLLDPATFYGSDVRS